MSPVLSLENPAVNGNWAPQVTLVTSRALQSNHCIFRSEKFGFESPCRACTRLFPTILSPPTDMYVAAQASSP